MKAAPAAPLLCLGELQPNLQQNLSSLLGTTVSCPSVLPQSAHGNDRRYHQGCFLSCFLRASARIEPIFSEYADCQNTNPSQTSPRPWCSTQIHVVYSLSSWQWFCQKQKQKILAAVFHLQVNVMAKLSLAFRSTIKDVFALFFFG